MLRTVKMHACKVEEPKVEQPKVVEPTKGSKKKGRATLVATNVLSGGKSTLETKNGKVYVK